MCRPSTTRSCTCPLADDVHGAQHPKIYLSVDHWYSVWFVSYCQSTWRCLIRREASPRPPHGPHRGQLRALMRCVHGFHVFYRLISAHMYLAATTRVCPLLDAPLTAVHDAHMSLLAVWRPRRRFTPDQPSPSRLAMAGGPCAMPEVHGQVIFRVLRAVDVVGQAASAAPRSRRSLHVEIFGVEEAQRRLLQLDALGASTSVAARPSSWAPDAHHQRPRLASAPSRSPRRRTA